MFQLEDELVSFAHGLDRLALSSLLVAHVEFDTESRLVKEAEG